MTGVQLVLFLHEIDDIEDALVMFIDYLRDGDEDDKRRAKRVEKTYNEFIKRVKWS